jgi:hypothetical protein
MNYHIPHVQDPAHPLRNELAARLAHPSRPAHEKEQTTTTPAPQQINITNTAAVAPLPGPVLTINSIEDFQLVITRVGTFTFPLASLFPVGTILPAGIPASDFAATIDWGDPTGDISAGTITQDASNPSVYDIKGTHTYTDPGTFPIGLTINLAGGSVTGTVNGTPVTINLPVATAAGTSATSTASASPTPR